MPDRSASGRGEDAVALCDGGDKKADLATGDHGGAKDGGWVERDGLGRR